MILMKKILKLYKPGVKKIFHWLTKKRLKG